MARRINAAGLKLVKQFESCRLRAYPDPGNAPPRGDGTPFTCGWGSTGPDIGPDTVWTQAQADARLEATLREVEAGVELLVTAKISDNAFSALCSLVYNIGLGNFKKSSMLRLINSGDIVGASRQFPLWVFAQKRRMPGLVMRRASEMNLFMRPDRG